MVAGGTVRRPSRQAVPQPKVVLNATGQRGEDLIPAAQFCVRVIHRLDEVVEQLRRSIP